MEKEQRNRLQKATQDARKLLEEEFRSQLLQTYDIDVEKVRWAEEPGAHLQAEQRLIREKLVAWIEHKEAQIHDRKEALLLALREMAFTALNRFVALKLMEARELVRPCVSGGLESAGFLEFSAVAQGLLADQESSYRLYLETIFEDVSRELRALFNPRDPASLLWPKRAALLELLEILNRPELAELWIEDETLGWVYQYFNGDAERKKMREESSAPRNSRELAVRNQFFTPRYVVEFLTDNTLGRIWYEMRQGKTGLKDRCRYLVRRPNEIWLQPGNEPPAQADADEALSQEELLRQPVYIPHRPLKDPREIRMLDPACGSMHFGLYAFDLYLEIYKEAWEIAQGSDGQSKQEEAFSPFVAYAAGFADKSAFLREVPKLILQHNIHGIDIDPRATQIARLTLWLRAQRFWREQQLRVADRPTITRSNVVCAEPMPGERELLADFVDQQFPDAERGLVQQLLEAIFDRMQLAGEAGSLLKIEDEIRDEISQARREWQRLAVRQKDLFSASELEALGEAGSSLNADIHSLTRSFWINIEERIYAALNLYAISADKEKGAKQRLFAEDAAQGFSLIEIASKRFEVVLMNPPFGLECPSSTDWLRGSYNGIYNDIFTCFVARGLSLAEDGLLGAITSRSFLVGRRHAKFREDWFLPRVSALLDLGQGVMDDAMVQSCAYILNDNTTSPTVPVYDWRESDLAARNHSQFALQSPFIFRLEDARRLPFSRFVYSIPRTIVNLFASGQTFEPLAGLAKAGMNSFDDFRFLRLFWEVPPGDIGFPNGWVRFAKGGEASSFRSPLYLLLGRHSDGRELDALNIQLHGSSAQVRQASRYWGQAGCTYSRRSKHFAVRCLPEKTVFSSMGPAVLPSETTSPGFLVAFLNSSLMQALVNFQASANDYQTGIIKALPYLEFHERTAASLASRGEALCLAKRSVDILEETDPEFCPVRHPASLQSGLDDELSIRSTAETEISLLKREVEAFIGEEYGEVAVSWASNLLLSGTEDDDSDADQSAEDIVDDASKVDPKAYACRQLSILLGVVYGRWNIGYLTGQRLPASPSGAFESLPACQPGLLKGKHEMPASIADIPEEYPVAIPWDGILIEDSGHQLDVVNCIYKLFDSLRGPGAVQASMARGMLQECIDILNCRDLRDWFRSSSCFFQDHLKRYTKCRRQAPIYWQISVGSNSYSAWLYYHRFTQDTLYRLLRDFVEPRIQQAEREQFEMESQGALSGDAATRLQEAQTLLQDLRLLKSELDLVAPLWNPNLNDGVIINHAILWRITPYTPWQKKCKECWDKLVKGDYDWAHLAFHLWPERVIPNCTTDRSLAIAHGLEERLWQETNNGNWLPRQLSEADLQALIAEHSNPAVKSALDRFLAAPPPVAPVRTRASRSTSASGVSAPRRARGSAAVVDAEATRQVLLALSAAPSDGLAKAAIADLIGVEANALTAVIKQLKESGQIDQLGERRGARYVLSEQGRAAVANQAGEDD